MPVLTKSYVDNLTASDKDVIVWDDKLSGFGIKVTPKGRKVYLLYYRTQDGRQRKPTIGVHGQITCEQARKIAEKWYGMRAAGEDPLAERLELRQSPTVSTLNLRPRLLRILKIHSIKACQVYSLTYYLTKKDAQKILPFGFLSKCSVMAQNKRFLMP